jgi:D-alanyl-D-alanine dipeptidase
MGTSHEGTALPASLPPGDNPGMSRFLTLVVLIGITVALLSVGEGYGGRGGEALLLGFLLLAAYLAGLATRAVELPRITGFLLRRIPPMNRQPLGTLLLLALLASCSGEARTDASPPAAAQASAATQAPSRPPEALRPLIGEYADGDTISVLEDAGTLRLLRWHGVPLELSRASDSTFAIRGSQAVATFRRGTGGGVTAMVLEGRTYVRLSLGAADGTQFRITPVREADELRAEALAATPPEEEGDFLPSELVELVTLDPSIHLDVRYATTNNFMGEVFYSQARAFLQRPAAEALVRANAWLKTQGYGLLVHDGYRPWYVTKMFWEATPESLRIFVADPASGSRHNRGCAVDLTLYELDSGEPVLMTGGYDEMSPRSFPDYPGGTSRQRWLRALLRQAMEAQGFTVYEAEWWHFDYQDWRRYRIGNQRFEELGDG